MLPCKASAYMYIHLLLLLKKGGNDVLYLVNFKNFTLWHRSYLASRFNMLNVLDLLAGGSRLPKALYKAKTNDFQK